MIDYFSNFSTLKSLLGDWVEKELSSGQSTNPVLHYISKGEPDWKKIQSLKTGQIDVATQTIIYELQFHHNVLVKLDAYLKILYNEPRINRFVEHLKQSDAFWQGYSEIETAALFKQHFGSVELEPRLKNRKAVDFCFVFNNKEIFVEINTPKLGQKFLDTLEQHSVKVSKKPIAYRVPDYTDRVKDILLREFEHFDGTEVLSLIIYNLNNTEVNGEDIAERLLGTAYAVIMTDQTTGKATLQLKRKADSVFINEPDLKNLGGIICYNREFNIQGQIFYSPIYLFGISVPISVMKTLGQPFV